MINDFHLEPSYDEVLRIGEEMTAACRESRFLMQIYSQQASHPTQSLSITAFHRNMIDHLNRSFLLILHRPSARKAREDPKFYYSRKVCLEAALAILAPEPDDHFTRLMTVAAGFMRNLIIHSSRWSFSSRPRLYWLISSLRQRTLLGIDNPA